MKLLSFTVYDQKAKCFLPPFFFPAVGQATRTFSDAINEKTHAFGKHPEDYILYQTADYDDETGLFTVSDDLQLHLISNGLSLVRIQPKENTNEDQQIGDETPV